MNAFRIIKGMNSLLIGINKEIKLICMFMRNYKQ